MEKMKIDTLRTASEIDLLEAAKAALAALSQNFTYPDDIAAAKMWLSEAIERCEK